MPYKWLRIHTCVLCLFLQLLDVLYLHEIDVNSCRGRSGERQQLLNCTPKVGQKTFGLQFTFKQLHRICWSKCKLLYLCNNLGISML